MKKKLIIFASLILMLLCGCEEKGADFIDAKVIEFDGEDVILEVEYSSREKFTETYVQISTNDDIVSSRGMPALKLDDSIRVLYGDIDTSTSPPKLTFIQAVNFKNLVEVDTKTLIVKIEELHENYMIVSPLNVEINELSKTIRVSLDVIYPKNAPELDKDGVVGVVYVGEISEAKEMPTIDCVLELVGKSAI